MSFTASPLPLSFSTKEKLAEEKPTSFLLPRKDAQRELCVRAAVRPAKSNDRNMHISVSRALADVELVVSFVLLTLTNEGIQAKNNENIHVFIHSTSTPDSGRLEHIL